MIIHLSAQANDEDLRRVLGVVKAAGRRGHVRRGEEGVSIVATGAAALSAETVGAMSEVASVVAHDDPFQLVSRKARARRTQVMVGGVAIGGGAAAPVVAGPCSVETREQLLETAAAIRRAGASLLRGGAYKPRTSPYEFQGLGVEGLRLLAEARELTGLPVVTEVMATEDVDVVSEHADMLQVGARNMQNFALLKALARCRRPVLLKRGPAASFKEWLMAAEYLLAGGNDQVVLCERGVKSFDSEATRNLLDVSAIALARELSHLPVMADPSHATGRRNLILPAARAALAAGADGLLVEVHPRPAEAWSDGPQSLTPSEFERLMQELSAPLPAIARPGAHVVAQAAAAQAACD